MWENSPSFVTPRRSRPVHVARGRKGSLYSPRGESRNTLSSLSLSSPVVPFPLPPSPKRVLSRCKYRAKITCQRGETRKGHRYFCARARREAEKRKAARSRRRREGKWPLAPVSKWKVEIYRRAHRTVRRIVDSVIRIACSNWERLALNEVPRCTFGWDRCSLQLEAATARWRQPSQIRRNSRRARHS